MSKEQFERYIENLESEKCYYDYHCLPYPENLKKELEEWGMLEEELPPFPPQEDIDAIKDKQGG